MYLICMALDCSIFLAIYMSSYNRFQRGLRPCGSPLLLLGHTPQVTTLISKLSNVEGERERSLN